MSYDVPTHIKTVEILKTALAAKKDYVYVPDLDGAVRFAFTALESFKAYVHRRENGVNFSWLTIQDGTKVKVYQEDPQAEHFHDLLASAEPKPKDTFDITPNISADQAKRIESALNQRQAAGEDLVRQFRDLLTTGITGSLKRLNHQESLIAIDEMTQTLASWDEHNKAFEAAVFEKRPAREPERVG